MGFDLVRSTLITTSVENSMGLGRDGAGAASSSPVSLVWPVTTSVNPSPLAVGFIHLAYGFSLWGRSIG